MGEQVNVHEAKTRLSELLARVERGDDIVIARGGVPVARLVAVEPLAERALGFLPGLDTTPAFFEPLPNDELLRLGALVALLLDTHALLWALGAPDRLPPRVRAILSDRRERIVVSAASAFEIATKYRLGRLDSAEPLVRDFTGIVERLGADQLPIRSAHGIAAGLLSWAHRDPFDRMLAAQASAEGLPLATVDRVFDEAAGVTVVWD